MIQQYLTPFKKCLQFFLKPQKNFSFLANISASLDPPLSKPNPEPNKKKNPPNMITYRMPIQEFYPYWQKYDKPKSWPARLRDKQIKKDNIGTFPEETPFGCTRLSACCCCCPCSRSRYLVAALHRYLYQGPLPWKKLRPRLRTQPKKPMQAADRKKTLTNALVQHAACVNLKGRRSRWPWPSTMGLHVLWLDPQKSRLVPNIRVCHNGN